MAEVGRFQVSPGLHSFWSCVGQDGDDLEDLEAKGKTKERTQEESKAKRDKQDLFI